MHLIKDIDTGYYATSDNRYGIEKIDSRCYVAWRTIIGQKTYYGQQISDTRRDTIYFKSFTSASEFLGREIESDKAKVIWSA